MKLIALISFLEFQGDAREVGLGLLEPSKQTLVCFVDLLGKLMDQGYLLAGEFHLTLPKYGFSSHFQDLPSQP
ncbi:MAG TPA: hypothetical protein VHO48_06875 [Anaerolineaceae bacterium]|nr:hypothetical protein [Anaerolineaceae bacterium]